MPKVKGDETYAEWSCDNEAELMAALLARSDEIDREADLFLFAWADWCGSDGSLIRGMLNKSSAIDPEIGCGVGSWLGRWRSSNLTGDDTTETSRQARPREMYDLRLYGLWERERAKLNGLQRKILRQKYQWRQRDDQVMFRVKLSGQDYVDELNTIRDRAHDLLSNTLIA